MLDRFCGCGPQPGPRLACQSDKHVGRQELLPSGGIAGLEDGEAIVEGGGEGGYLGSTQLPLSAACDQMYQIGAQRLRWVDGEGSWNLRWRW